MRCGAFAVAALLCAAGALVLWAGPQPAARAQSGGASTPAPPGDRALIAQGRALFVSGCGYCHGEQANGINGLGPTLHGVGARAADFYLSTGRMPLSSPTRQPDRNDHLEYTAGERRALVAYVASLGGPPIPTVHPERGDAALGQQLFGESCAGCHAITARGGIVPGGIAPALGQATPTQIAEAVRVGPYLMPRFDQRQIDQHELDSITSYVLTTRHLDDRGGWGIGNIGPVPEGMIAWLLAGTALVLVLRLVGERA
ncbi:MAG: ubiquinol-cytochrome c reductase cytochrome c subunit [Solirubrobacteraceae bacterium]|nr:ubiquinol-cytochrome c reductase cytochrome c subunit [Solirubrobacteraceae bacterium]